MIVLTVGVLPRENGTRADVLGDSVDTDRGIVPRLAEICPSAVFITVTNPVDAMTYAAFRLAGSPRGRVIGTGMVLDSLRLRAFIGEASGLYPVRVSIDVVGEHGDTMVPLWSHAAYEGRPLGVALAEAGPVAMQEAKAALVERTRRAGWEIRLAGEHSCYGIAFSATRIIEEVLHPSDCRLAVSAPFEGECGIRGVVMSLPTQLGARGVAARVVPPMDEHERAALLQSSEALLPQMAVVDALLR